MSMGLLPEFWSSGLLSSPQAWVSTGSQGIEHQPNSTRIPQVPIATQGG